MSSDPTSKPLVNRPVVLAGVVLLLLACILALVGRTILAPYFKPQVSGPFDRQHFEDIVSRVRAMPVPRGTTACFRLEKPSDPASLRSCPCQESLMRGTGTGKVFAETTPEGTLKVVIETKDLGHMGEYGFAYSDVRLTPKSFSGAWFSLDVPGHLSLVERTMEIDEHWWQVLYNLD